IAAIFAQPETMLRIEVGAPWRGARRRGLEQRDFACCPPPPSPEEMLGGLMMQERRVQPALPEQKVT
ncbi:MAG TPA: hypothetical protein VGM00_03825, partial [Bradyrhizobium sp.]